MYVCFFVCWKYWKVPLHLLVKWEVVSPNSRYRAFYHEIGNIEKCPFTYWLNGRWFLQIVDIHVGNFNMKLTGRWFPQIVVRDSGNLYPIYIYNKNCGVSFWTCSREISGDRVALFFMLSWPPCDPRWSFSKWTSIRHDIFFSVLQQVSLHRRCPLIREGCIYIHVCYNWPQEGILQGMPSSACALMRPEVNWCWYSKTCDKGHLSGCLIFIFCEPKYTLNLEMYLLSCRDTYWGVPSSQVLLYQHINEFGEYNFASINILEKKLQHLSYIFWTHLEVDWWGLEV